MSDHRDDEHDKTPPSVDERLVFGDAPEDEADPVPEQSAALDEVDDPIEHDMFSSDEPEDEPVEDRRRQPDFAADDEADDADADEMVLGEADEVDDVEEADVTPAEPLAAPKRRAAPAAAPAEKPDRVAGGWVSAMFKFAGFAFAAGALFLIGGAGFSAWYLHQLNKDLPAYEQLAEYAPPVTTRVYAGDGSLVAEFARERRLFVPIEAMPDHVKLAFVSAEDQSFYEHSGIDLRGLVRAQLSNVGNVLRGRRLEGGSTITQQVAKNFLLTSEQRVERKLREMLIARKISG